jgi:acyl-coenzyme A thioesterase 1/2/4
MTTAKLEATPDVALLPTPIAIVASGFRPGERVTLRSRLVDDAGVEWAAHGLFVADAQGRIDLAEAPSEEGTYAGVDAAGLLWSMRPAPVCDRGFMIGATERLHKIGLPHVDPVKALRFELSASVDGAVRARCPLTLQRLADGIEVQALRDGLLRGTVFRWRDRSRPRGAIMSLTGSGGGVEMGFAPVLASLGYDVLSLAYFSFEDLPAAISAIPLEYFADGLAWMRRELGATRLAVQGASRGGEATMAIASYLPELIDGALAIVPMYTTSHGWDPARGADGNRGPSWTWQGQDVPYAPALPGTSFEDMKRIGDASPNGFVMTPEYHAMLNQPAARLHAALPIERFKGRLLMISGQDDQMWPSSWGADRVVDRLRALGHRHPYQHLSLPDTGHVTPLPNTVTTFTPAIYHSLLNVFLACGGNPAATARTSRLTWEAMKAHYRAVFEA